MKINYDELCPDVCYNKNGKPNKNSVKKRMCADKAVETLRKYEEDESLAFHHVSVIAGQMPRKSGCKVKAYHGKFGDGIIVDVPNYFVGSRYFKRFYFIEKEGVPDATTT